MDHGLTLIGPSGSLPGSDEVVVAFFTRESLSRIDGLLVRIRAVDQVGDTHERVLHCMRGPVEEALASGMG